MIRLRKTIGVSFEGSDKIYYFDSNKLTLNKNDNVIVETERGLQYGKAVTDILEIDEKNLGKELKYVIRKADDKDSKAYEKNKKDALHALKSARDIADVSHKLAGLKKRHQIAGKD